MSAEYKEIKNHVDWLHETNYTAIKKSSWWASQEKISTPLKLKKRRISSFDCDNKHVLTNEQCDFKSSDHRLLANHKRHCKNGPFLCMSNEAKASF
eukprot:262152_1